MNGKSFVELTVPINELISSKINQQIFSKLIIMKTKKLNLKIDTIGGLSSLTIAEEKALSDFFKMKKSVNKII